MDMSFSGDCRTLQLPPVPTVQTSVVTVRMLQARILWDLGCGRDHQRFDEYLATIPEMVSRPRMQREWRPVLVDPSISSTCLSQAIGLRGIEACSAARESAPSRGVYWMWAAFDDPVHRSRPPFETLRRATGSEAPLSLHEVLSMVAQDPSLLKMHGFVAAASKLERFPSYYLAVFLHEGHGTVGVTEGCAMVYRMRTPLKHFP